jgi:methylenetetrahydrofolate dehydrogenase (NADP+) / methenyltetrahydrofolate cyclohydrolase
MAATLLDGKAVAARVREELAQQLRNWPLTVRPGLAVLLVGDDPASAVYVRNKISACEGVGIELGIQVDVSPPVGVLDWTQLGSPSMVTCSSHAGL